MKKILTGLIAICLCSMVCMAQAVKKVTVKTTETKMKVVPRKRITLSKNVATNVNQKTATKKGSVVLKQDGTPDKRYNSATVVQLKKDGTPDKRFKNKKKN